MSMSNNVNVGKTVAVVVVVAALLFVAYGELSNSVSGAYGYQDLKCDDSDPENNPAVQGTLIFIQPNIQKTTTHDDLCLGNKRLEQWTCGPNNRPQELVSYCEYTCSNGMCV